VPPHEPSYTTVGSTESPRGRPDPGVEHVSDFALLREDLDAALRFAEDLQKNVAHLALFRWVGITIAFLSLSVFALLSPSLITSFRLGVEKTVREAGPALIGSLTSFCAAWGSMMVTMYFQRRLRREVRALHWTSQLLHEVAGSQQSSLSPIQRELLRLRLSRLDYAVR
jgi:hypothetical protein